MKPSINSIFGAMIKYIKTHKDETDTRIYAISDMVFVLQEIKPDTKINGRAFSVNAQKYLGMETVQERSSDHQTQPTRGF